MREGPQVRAEPVEVAGRMDELGIEEAVLRNAVLSGFQHASTCSEHDPPNLRGILFWARAVRSLRDQQVAKRWTAADRHNYSTVDHPDTPLSIAVAAGDANSGRVDADPTTRTEKGPATRQAVNRNQMSFEDEDEDFPKTRQTWLLLHYVDEDADELRLELSLPADFADGYITEWRERVILGSVPLSPGSQEEEDEESEEVDVSVERRSN